MSSRPAHGSQRGVNWEPPIDVLETADAVLIFAALPGVEADKVANSPSTTAS